MRSKAGGGPLGPVVKEVGIDAVGDDLDGAPGHPRRRHLDLDLDRHAGAGLPRTRYRRGDATGRHQMALVQALRHQRLEGVADSLALLLAGPLPRRMESTEFCDDGGESATCDVDCTAAACGDGVTNTTAGEECATSMIISRLSSSRTTCNA